MPCVICEVYMEVYKTNSKAEPQSDWLALKAAGQVAGKRRPGASLEPSGHACGTNATSDVQLLA